MRRFLLTLCCTLIVLNTPSRAVAWNKAGHMLTGAVAYRVLKRLIPRLSPALSTFLGSILSMKKSGCQ
jgi:hypothetical protein